MQKKNRPNKISTAITLLWITVAIGIILNIIEFPTSLKTATDAGLGLGFTISTIFFSLAITAFFIFMIGNGKNWARITFLVLFIIGIPFSVPIIIQSLITNPILGIIGVGQTILQIIALVFLFQKPSSTWFNSIKK